MAVEEGTWTKAGVLVGVLALLVGYAGVANSNHWWPFASAYGSHPASKGSASAAPTGITDPQSTRPTATDSTTSRPRSVSACTKKLQITSPAEGTVIANGNNGVLIKGTACGLASDSGWLFELDSQDNYYYADYSGNTPAPVVGPSQSGIWYFNDSPIGDSGDNHKLYTLTLVLASPGCDKALRNEPTIDGDYKLRSFPAECQVASKVDVYVTTP